MYHTNREEKTEREHYARSVRSKSDFAKFSPDLVSNATSFFVIYDKLTRHLNLRKSWKIFLFLVVELIEKWPKSLLFEVLRLGEQLNFLEIHCADRV